MEFIENHADVGDNVKVNDDDDDAGQVRTLLDKEFIHNEESFWDQGPSDYRLSQKIGPKLVQILMTGMNISALIPKTTCMILAKILCLNIMNLRATKKELKNLTRV